MTTYQIDGGQDAGLAARFGIRYETFGFDEEYFSVLLDHMGLDPDRVDKKDFANWHFDLLFTYLQVKQAQDTYLTIEQENKLLSEAQKHAKALSDKLVELEGALEVRRRLHEELGQLPYPTFQHDDTTIAQMRGPAGGRAFEGLTDFLFDLQVGLELAKITTKRIPGAPFLQAPQDDNIKGHKKYSEHVIQAFSRVGQDQWNHDRYLKRRKEHAGSYKIGMLAFAETFRDFWEAYSDYPFTEGRYEKVVKQRISRIADAAEHCLRKFGYEGKRSLIENSLREARQG